MGKIEPKVSNYLPNYPKPHITNLKDLFDHEVGVMPILVEINMINKHMRF